ncbi:helix-turn-helix domain-containing protein [Umezawaea endophytica]|uniref:Helix-turn-helix domain-containing protein n=1 Tax=Umezawaea endophytica TaxID=1654476 RepID=A0A9X2VFX1_9PSEU|nr:helix-turn-helix transcriptional regulator [Umezawaea endophytica]MCS7475923.1 helix-turn-helix domain-containing protein [Umezawaea endophytica]
MPTDEGLDWAGKRVSAQRKLRGLSQQQLADAANVSKSLVKAVEQGRVPASAAFIASVSRALLTDAATLLSQPYLLDDQDGRSVHSVIPGLRREIASYRLPVDDKVQPRSYSDLSQAVAAVSKKRHAATLDTLGAELPGVLSEIRVAIEWANPSDRMKLYGLLAEAYAAAGQVVWKLGYPDLSSLTTERVEWAARKSGDPLAIAAADFYVAGELIAAAEWSGALRYLDDARHRIEDEARSGNEAALSMYGVLHLKSGLAAARAGDAVTSDSHLDEARDTASRVQPGSDYYRLAFDADSVAIWSVGLAVERLDGTEAVKRADGLRFRSSTPRERVGHHWIDLARAYQLHGNRERALSTLVVARRVAPQQARYHPQVRETLVTLAEHDRRRSESLAGMARWVGVKL